MATLTTDDFFPNATLTITNDAGDPAPVEGAPIWASSDETVLSVDASADGLTASVNTVAPGGPARITVTADADLGEGVVTITGVSEDITVTTGTAQRASVVAITLGASAPKVTPPPVA